MNARILKSIMLMAIMTLSISAFAQEPIPTANPSVYVSVPLNGCVCPDSGVITSHWWWIKTNPVGYEQCAGTPIYYSSIPAGGFTESVITFPGYTVSTVSIMIQPFGGVGINSKTVSYPAGTVEIRPSSCCPPGAFCNCPDRNKIE